MKKYVPAFAYSLFFFLLLTPLGGYGGHHIKFSVANIAYCCLTYFLIRQTPTPQDRLTMAGAIALPVLLIWIPLHLLDFAETLYALPSSIAHITGIGAGFFLATALSNVKKLTFLLCFMAALWWVTDAGYSYWSNKVFFGTFTGLVDEKIDPFTLQTADGQLINSSSMKGQTVVFDFWNTGCGSCFSKFPDLQAYHTRYKSNSKVKFFAVNVPLSRDTTGQAAAIMQRLGYTVPVLVAEKKTLASLFKINSYPTVLIIDPSHHVIYRGQLDGIDTPLRELTDYN